MSQRSISLDEVGKHNRMDDAWIAFDGGVYDVSDFVHNHPGGSEILEEWLGKDISSAFRDIHTHSPSAKDVLLTMRVGHLAGAAEKTVGESEAQKLAQKVIDPSKPYTFQVGLLGKHYQDWVHTPIHVKDPIVLLGGWLEPFTKVYWWVPLVFWIPAVLAMLRFAVTTWSLWKVAVLYFGMAVCGWPFLEFFLHRVLYHMSTESYWGNTAHFLFHGVHHLTPMDKTRLVAPPPLAIFIASPLCFAIYNLSPSAQFAWTMIAGLFSGYLVYDEIHYWIHHGDLPWEWLKKLKSHHMAHHYGHPNENFGVSNTFTDILFGTLAPYEMEDQKKKK